MNNRSSSTNEYLELLWIFLKIGLSTFGGGYAMVPVLEKELIQKKGWITMDEVIDYYTIAQITPGIIAINMATFIGYKRKGFPGAVIATISFAVPGVTFMALISLFISGFAEHAVVQHAFAGIRVAVGAIIVDTIIKLIKGFYKNVKSVVICIIAFALVIFLGTSPVYVVLGAGLLGWILYRPKKVPIVKNGEGDQ